MATELAHGKPTVRDLVEVVDAEIGKRQDAWAPSLAKTGLSIARFRAGILQAVRANPRLLECHPTEIVNAAAKALALGLDVSGMTGEAFLIGPLMKSTRRGDQWVKVPTCELWKGVHGVIKLSYRSGLVKLIQPGIAREGDDFDVDLGADAPVRHKPRSGIAPIMAWYAQVRIATGGVLVGIIWRDEAGGIVADARARLGNGFDKSPWATHPDEMLQKTAVMRALKWAPKSVEQAELLTPDDEYRVERAAPVALVAPPRDEPHALGYSEPVTVDMEPEPPRAQERRQASHPAQTSPSTFAPVSEAPAASQTPPPPDDALPEVARWRNECANLLTTRNGDDLWRKGESVETASLAALKIAVEVLRKRCTKAQSKLLASLAEEVGEPRTVVQQKYGVRSRAYLTATGCSAEIDRLTALRDARIPDDRLRDPSEPGYDDAPMFSGGEP